MEAGDYEGQVLDDAMDEEPQLVDSDEQQLEDEGADLFGLQDEPLEDELPPEPAEQQQPQHAPEPEPVAPGKKSMRDTLVALAKKKRAENQAAAEGEQPPRKKKKRDKDKEQQARAERGQGSSKRARGAGDEAAPGRAQRAKRARAEPGEDGAAAAAAAAGDAGAVEVPEDEEAVENEEDRAFIDDDGLAPEERYEEDADAIAAAEEAEEAGEGEEEPLSLIDEILARRKRRRSAKEGQEGQLGVDMVDLCKRMETAAKTDAANLAARPPKPAIQKLQALAHVSKCLRQRKYHEAFIANQGLVQLASWLRPYANGTLPNTKVRAELLDLLALLGLDTTNDYIREALEASGLGSLAMFYSKAPSESLALKAKWRELVLLWSAPIFADTDEEARKRRQRERAHRQRQAAERDERERRKRLEEAQAERRRKLNVGEEGFRARAAVPQPSRMDFVINPGSKAEAREPAAFSRGAAPGGAGPKGKASPIGGKLGDVLRARKRGPRDRIGGMSVEGRGIQL